MKNVTILELENDFDALMQLVREGTELVVSDGDAPIARVVPCADANPEDAKGLA